MANTLFDELKSFSETAFREIYQKFIYIHCRELLDVILPGELEGSITGLVAYCYIDRTEGLSLRPVMIASVKEYSLQVFTFPHLEDTLYVLRLRDGEPEMSELHEGCNHMYLYTVDLDKYRFFDISVVGFDTESLQMIKDDIDSTYSAGEMVEDLRSWRYAFLDMYRNPYFPDDVQALIVGEDKFIEQVWVRLKFVTEDGEIFGELLNEPYRDQGCHEGDLIELKEVRTHYGTFLVFTGRTAEK